MHSSISSTSSRAARRSSAQSSSEIVALGVELVGRAQQQRLARGPALGARARARPARPPRRVRPASRAEALVVAATRRRSRSCGRRAGSAARCRARGSRPPGISRPAKRSHRRNSRRWRASVVKMLGGPPPVAAPITRAIAWLTRPICRRPPGAIRGGADMGLRLVSGAPLWLPHAEKTYATWRSSPTSTTARPRSSTPCCGSPAPSARTRTSTSASWTRWTSSARRASRSSPRTRRCATAA